MNREDYLQIRNGLNFRLSYFQLTTSLIINILLLVGAYSLWVADPSSVTKYLGAPLIAIFIFRSFGILHEASHNLISRRKIFNDIIGVLNGSICLLPYEPWKKSHLQHHLWSGNVEKDPVMALKIVFPGFPKWVKILFDICWRLWVPLIALAQYAVFWYLSLSQVLRKPDSFLMVLSTASPLIFWCLVFTNVPLAFALSVILPGLYIYMIAFEVVGLVHHMNLPEVRGTIRFPVWQQHVRTRSCVYPKWFAAFTVLNFNYHVEHHLFPDAPWYVLEKLHQKIKVALGSDYNSSPNFAWSVSSRKDNFEHILMSKIEAESQAKQAG